MPRNSGKHWSAWDQLALALMPDEAVKRRWPSRGGRVRWAIGSPLTWIVAATVVAIAALGAVRFGRVFVEGFVGALCLVWLVVAVVAPTLNREKVRKLIALRRERVRVVRGLERDGTAEAIGEAAASVAQRRVGAETRLAAELGAVRGLLTVAKFNPIAWRLCSIAWMLIVVRGVGMRRVWPWMEEASLGGAIAMMVLVYFITRSDRNLARTAIPQSLCPDCGYPLSDVVPKFADEGQTLGPERCTECGAPWPLIPPDGWGPARSGRPQLADLAKARTGEAADSPGGS